MRETHLPDLLAREIEHAVVQADQSDTEGGRMNEGGLRRRRRVRGLTEARRSV